MKKTLLTSLALVAALSVSSVSLAQGWNPLNPNAPKPVVVTDAPDPEPETNPAPDAEPEPTSDSAPAVPADEPAPFQRFGVVFGRTHTVDFEKEEIVEAPFGSVFANSVLSVAQTMEKSGYFSAIGGLAGNALTKDNVNKVFDALLESSNPGDEIVIYWAGDSGQLPDDNGDEADGKDEVLALLETTTVLDEDPVKSLRKTTLTDDELGDLIGALKDRRVYLILETSNASGFAEIKTEDEPNADADDAVAVLRRMMGKSIGSGNFKSVAKAGLNSVKSLRGTAPSLKSMKFPATNSTRNTNDFGARLLRGTSAASNGKNGFIDDIRAHAKDIGNTAPIAAVFSAADGEMALPGTYNGSEFIPFMPLAVLYVIGHNGLEENDVDITFAKFCEVGEKLINDTAQAAREKIDGFENFTQTCSSIQTLPDAYIHKSSRPQ